ncbi:MAG: YscO family type III secretion system apparatus protein [Bilophila sp.]
MAYPLPSLLTVRHFREEAAKNEVRAAERRRCGSTGGSAERRRAELERYAAWRPEEAERRYAAILGASLSLDDVAEFRAAPRGFGGRRIAGTRASRSRGRGKNGPPGRP